MDTARTAPRRRLRHAVLPVLAGCALALTGCAGTSGTPRAAGSPSADAGSGFHGLEPADPMTRPSFTLTDLDGNRYDFTQQTAGRPTLLYFGYTNCPDKCPASLADIAAAMRSTPAALRQKVRVVFVTTDPARDRPEVLRAYLAKFDTTFIGLVGTQDEVDEAQRAAGINAAVLGTPSPSPVPGGGTKVAYDVGHANAIFGYDTRDQLDVVYPEEAAPSDIAADLPTLAGGAAR